MKKTFFALLFIIHHASLITKAQPFVGHQSSNYAGVYRAFFNPSSIVGTQVKWQLNGVTFNSTINNKYFKYFANNALFHPMTNAYTSTDMYGKSKLTGSFTQGSTPNVWSELVLPSGYVAFGESNQFVVGATSRMRGVVQGSGLPQIMSDVYTKRLDFGTIQESKGSFSNFMMSQKSFFEVGIMGAAAFEVEGIVKFKIGGALKYLTGGRNVFLNIKNTQYQVRSIAADEALLDFTNLNYEYGYTNKVEPLSLKPNNKYGKGQAVDVGMTLELGTIRNDASYRSNYIVRIGAAIADIGFFDFGNNNLNVYSGTLPKLTLNQDNVIDFGNNSAAAFDKYLPKSKTTSLTDYRVELPTTANFDIDVHVAKSFFVNGSLMKSMAKNALSPTQIVQPQMITITPRWEDIDAQFTMPISWVEGNSSPSVGFSVRLGSAFIGFSNFSGLVKINAPRTTFTYFGLQLWGTNHQKNEE